MELETGSGIHLCTSGFTKLEVLNLINVLDKKFGLKCSLHSINRIYIWKKSVKEFIQIIEPHLEPSMKYKINWFKKDNLTN